LFFLYDFFFTRGYCTDAGPREYRTTLINTLNVKKIYYGYEFDLFTFSSLNWLYDLFYVNGKKTISPMLINYLTPMALAFLIMDDGGWVSGSKSVRISTNNFTLQEVELLSQMFKTASLIVLFSYFPRVKEILLRINIQFISKLPLYLN